MNKVQDLINQYEAEKNIITEEIEHMRFTHNFARKVERRNTLETVIIDLTDILNSESSQDVSNAQS